jgi:hypothetical protein
MTTDDARDSIHSSARVVVEKERIRAGDVVERQQQRLTKPLNLAFY